MPEDARKLVGQNVRKLRLAAKISQAELATRMGVDRAYVSGLEQGSRNPTVITLWHLAKALDVPLRALFREQVRRTDTQKRPLDSSRIGIKRRLS